MAIDSTSFTNTPQAGNDIYNLTEDQLFALGIIKPANILSLDVMANDLGGNAKKLFSVDDGNRGSLNPTGLLMADRLVNGASARECTANGDMTGAEVNAPWSTIGVGHDKPAMGCGNPA